MNQRNVFFDLYIYMVGREVRFSGTFTRIPSNDTNGILYKKNHANLHSH